MPAIDQLCYASALRRVNAGEKSAFSILTLLICVISRSVLIAMVVLVANTILTVGIGKISLTRYRKLMMVPLAFLTLSTLAIIVNFSETPFDAYAIPLGSIYLTSSTVSLLFAGQLILTALAAVSSLYFLALSTPATDLMMVLEKLHCPLILTELMLLIYRFVFVLLSVASAIRVSQQSRLGYQDFRTSVKSFGGLGAMLFIRAMKRANAIYNAMESRGYDGRIRVLKEEYPPRPKEVAYIVLFELALAGIWIGGNYL